MTSGLCISVTFLDPCFHGMGDEEPEWPPSPMRLFQALLAGARTGCREKEWTDRRAEAFRWLERQPPPLIIAPAAVPGSGYTLYVPNNDSDVKPERQDRLTGKRTAPHLLKDGNSVHFIWALKVDKSVDEGHAAELCRAARHLLALGWGIDQVLGNGRILSDSEVGELAGQQWRPWRIRRPEVQSWRVPTADSLQDLERVHESFMKRIEGGQYNTPLTFKRFDSVVYLRGGVVPPRHYTAFELPSGVAFRQEVASVVAAMLRSTACGCAKTDTHEFPGGSEAYVAGHIANNVDPPPRFSYLPLPTIGHAHADGMIRRFMIAEPYGGNGSEAVWAERRLRNQYLRDMDGNDRGILLGISSTASRRVVKRYVDESIDWASVTPVILPGRDDGKRNKAERLLLKSIGQAGLPMGVVADIALRKAPFWTGSDHPQRYQRPQYLKSFPGWHVMLKFREPLAGPLAIGAGRHCGLGIFARMESP